MTVTPTDSLRSRWGLPRFGYRANAFMLWIGSRFLPLAYFFIYFAAAYFYLFAPRARRASIRFLDKVHGPRPFFRRHVQTYRHMVMFGKILLDRAIMLTTPQHDFVITCDGLPNLRRALDMNKGVLLLTAHFGSAETTAPYMFKMGLTRPVHIVMYQDVSDSTERFHTRHRVQLAKIHIISTTDPLNAGIKIIAALRKGDAVAIRADRTLDGKMVAVQFMGQMVNFPAGPFIAAALTDTPVVHTYTLRVHHREYTCILTAPQTYGDSTAGSRDERTQRAAQDFATSLEAYVKQHPAQWSNFYDFWTTQSATSPDASA